MGMAEPSDFPVTRRALEQLDEWVMALASPLLPLQTLVLPHTSGFLWKFREESDRAVLVGKSVRLASGVRAAFMLADMGYISECGTILRTVSDFTTEIISICEGCKRGTPTTAQKRFLDQYFKPIPKDPDEYDDNQSKESWVARDDLFKAHCRWATENKGDPQRLKKVLRFLAHMYDKFVHGAYITSMELYDGRTNTFALRGNVPDYKRTEYKAAVASKLHGALTALFGMAELAKMPSLADDIRRVAQELYKSGELSGG